MTWGLRGVTVRFGHRAVLQEVDLDAAAGSVIAVVGGDGAGKTTTLRTLVGLVRPDRGSVLRPDARRIGYFGAATGVYPDLTVAENLAFVTQAYRMHDVARLEQLVSAAGLTEAQGLLGAQLSGGMRQKLGLVMAALHRPDLLVLDEPTTGVDPVSRAELGRFIARSASDGAAVVLSTAYLDEAERANSVVVLDDGRVLRAGSPEDIVASVPGGVVITADRPDSPTTWRRGDGWHRWAPETAGTVPPDIEDAVIIASLERSLR